MKTMQFLYRNDDYANWDTMWQQCELCIDWNLCEILIDVKTKQIGYRYEDYANLNQCENQAICV